MPQRLAAFLAEHNIARGFASLDEAIAWGGFDAAANITPDAAHYATTLQLIAAGKHVFCEKPLAPTYPDALAMTEAVEAAGLVNMVNLRYRGLPVMQKARALVAEGAIGAVRHIDAAFLQSWLVGNHWGDWRTEERWLWRLSHAHGSKGVLGDLGIHILDFAAFVSGQSASSVHCRMKSFAKADGDRIGAYGLDANDSFIMSIEFDGGAMGVVHASRWTTGYANAQKVGIYGTRGRAGDHVRERGVVAARLPGRGRPHPDLAPEVDVPAGAADLCGAFIDAVLGQRAVGSRFPPRGGAAAGPRFVLRIRPHRPCAIPVEALPDRGAGGGRLSSQPVLSSGSGLSKIARRCLHDHVGVGDDGDELGVGLDHSHGVEVERTVLGEVAEPHRRRLAGGPRGVAGEPLAHQCGLGGGAHGRPPGWIGSQDRSSPGTVYVR